MGKTPERITRGTVKQDLRKNYAYYGEEVFRNSAEVVWQYFQEYLTSCAGAYRKAFDRAEKEGIIVRKNRKRPASSPELDSVDSLKSESEDFPRPEGYFPIPFRQRPEDWLKEYEQRLVGA